MGTIKIEFDTKNKKKMGRPVKNELKGHKREYCKTINIAVDKEVLEEVYNVALPARGFNLTDYVNDLIRKDLRENKKGYKQLLEAQKAFIE